MTFDEKREEILVVEDIGRIIDGEGTATERLALLERLKARPGADALLQALSSDHARLQQSIPADMPAATARRLENVIDREFARRQPVVGPVSRAWWLRPPLQAAAALLLIAGTFVATTVWMESRMDSAVASLTARFEKERTLLAQTVQEALETRVSGDPIQIDRSGGWTEVFTPVKTYRSTSGHWCRQYLRETTYSGLDLTIRGTACRDADGTWTTVFAEPVSESFSAGAAGI